MAIAYVTSAITADTNTKTASITVSGTDTLMIAIVKDGFQGTMDFNGDAMTQLGSWGSPDTAVFYLINPDAGAHNVTLTTGNPGGSSMRFIASVYSGVAQTGFPDSSASANSSIDSTLNTTVVAANCWIIGMGTANSATNDNMTISRTTRQHGNYSAGGGGQGSIILGDSNTTVSTGAQGFDFNDGIGAPSNESQYVVSIAPVGAAGATHRLLTLGAG